MRVYDDERGLQTEPTCLCAWENGGWGGAEAVAQDWVSLRSSIVKNPLEQFGAYPKPIKGRARRPQSSMSYLFLGAQQTPKSCPGLRNQAVGRTEVSGSSGGFSRSEELYKSPSEVRRGHGDRFRAQKGISWERDHERHT